MYSAWKSASQKQKLKQDNSREYKTTFEMNLEVEIL